MSRAPETERSPGQSVQQSRRRLLAVYRRGKLALQRP